MTNSPINPEEVLLEEYDDLDVPFLDIAVILITVGDCLDIDPIQFMRCLDNDTLNDLRQSHGRKEIDLMEDLVAEAIESSTQLPHITRALEIHRLRSALDT